MNDFISWFFKKVIPTLIIIGMGIFGLGQITYYNQNVFGIILGLIVLGICIYLAYILNAHKPGDKRR